MNIDSLIQELNDSFVLNTEALDNLIRKHGEDIDQVDWSNVKNVYNVSNHYNQVCAYKQLNLMIMREARVGSAVKGYAVICILNYINSSRSQAMIQLSKDVSRATKSSIRRPGRRTKQEVEILGLKRQLSNKKQELAKRDEQIYELNKELKDKKEEITTLKEIGKQLIINNIKLASVSGINISVEDLES